MTNQNQSEVKYWVVCDDKYIILSGPKGLRTGDCVVLKPEYDKLKEVNHSLRVRYEVLKASNERVEREYMRLREEALFNSSKTPISSNFPEIPDSSI